MANERPNPKLKDNDPRKYHQQMDLYYRNQAHDLQVKREKAIALHEKHEKMAKKK